MANNKPFDKWTTKELVVFYVITPALFIIIQQLSKDLQQEEIAAFLGAGFTAKMVNGQIKQIYRLINKHNVLNERVTGSSIDIFRKLNMFKIKVV